MRRSPRLYGGVRVPNAPSPANAERIDMNALPLIIRMVQRGLQVDPDHFSLMEVELTRDMENVTEKVHTLTGYHINLGSGDQVSDLLFKKLGIKQVRPKMTRSGDRESVEDEVLTAIQHEHPAVALCLEYKEYEKLRGTYVRPLLKLARRVSFGEWRVFPNFRTTRVPSGRLSCADPNLLAMPTRTERGKDIRRGFITREGWCYVSVDLSQIEMRMAAHRSGDANLIRIYQQKEDIYSDFAISAFRLEDKRVKDAGGKWLYPTVDVMTHRYPAKTCVLASLYRVTAGGLLEQMPTICSICNTCHNFRDSKGTGLCEGCKNPQPKHKCFRFSSLWTEPKCQGLITAFYNRYRGLGKMQVADDTYVRRYALQYDMWGRILQVQAARSVLNWVVSKALREAGNFPLQSGAQGVIKIAMAGVSDQLDAAPALADIVGPLLQVHDELVFECREDIADDLIEMNKYYMENAVELLVPVKASGGKAPTWGDLPK